MHRGEKSSARAASWRKAGGVANRQPASVVVRPTNESDEEALFDLRTAVASEGRWIATEAPVDRDVHRARIVEQLAREDAASLVALVDGRLVGWLGVQLRSGDADLGMFVAPEHRARGVGSALVEACVEWAKTAGAHRLSLTVFPHNHPARALYAKFGFVTEGTMRRAIRRRNGELWDAIAMGLVLDTEAPGGELRGHGTYRHSALHPPEGGLPVGDLVLRPGRLADAETLAAAIDDPEIHRWLPAIPHPYTLEDAHALLAETRRQWTEAEGTHFVVTRDDQVIGGIGLSFDPRAPRLAEASYWVARDARDRRVATAALQALVAWAFDTLALRRIEIHAAFENTASRKVAESAGFEMEGIQRSWRIVHGVPTDFVLYARLAGRSG